MCVQYFPFLTNFVLVVKGVDESQRTQTELACPGTEHRTWTHPGACAGVWPPQSLISFTPCHLVNAAWLWGFMVEEAHPKVPQFIPSYS